VKAVSDIDKVTLDGRLFHMRKAATGSAQSPVAHRRYDVNAYLICCHESMSPTLWSSSARYGGSVKLCTLLERTQTVIVAPGVEECIVHCTDLNRPLSEIVKSVLI